MSNNAVIQRKSDILKQKDAIKTYLDSLFETIPPVSQADVTSKEKSKQNIEGRVPQWATSSFSVLSFRSAGLHLYVPVSFVRGIKNVGEGILPIKGSTDWIKGRVQSKSRIITVIDTEKLLIASNTREVEYQHPDENAYVILLGDGSFGLICDTIGKVKQVSSSDIHWRASAKKRNFISGMFKSEVAALLDARRIALAVSMHGTLV